jgi:two-component system, cell cycle sensor histidine kinase and response regulator CckA
VRHLCKDMLEQFEFKVITAADGQEGVDLFRRHADEISFVLLDLSMPRMNGQATFLALREIRPEVKVILSSGYNEQEATQHFAGQGLAAFLQKPYQLQSLKETVEQVLSS